MRRRRNDTAPFSLFAFQDIITATTGIMILIVILMTLMLITSFAQQPPQQQTEDLTEQMQIVLVETKGEIQHKQEEMESNRTELQQVTVYTRERLEKERLETDRQKDKFEDELKQVTARLERTKQDNKKWDTRLAVQRANYERQRRELEKLQSQLKQRERELENAHQQLTSNRSRLATTQPDNRILYNRSSESGKSAWLVQIDRDRIMAARAGLTESPHVFSADGSEFLSWARGIDSNANYFFLLLRPGNVPAFDKIKAELRRAGYDFGVELLGPDQFAVDRVKGGGQ